MRMPRPVVAAIRGRAGGRLVRWARRAGAGQCPQWREGVVADPAGPDEVPERGAECLVVGRPDRDVGELAEEPRSAGRQGIQHGLVELDRVLEGLVLRQRQRRLVGEMERDPAVGAGQTTPWPAQSTSPEAVSSSR